MISYSDSILSLELTDYCNCKCKMCTQSVQDIIHGNSKGYMDIELIKEIFTNLKNNGIKIGKLLPFGLGESTIHKDFKEIMNFIFKENRDNSIFSYLDLHTNGINFTEDLFELFIKNSDQMGTITFSLDAAREETFAEIRGNSSFKISRKNLMDFILKRKSSGKEYPHVIIQFIVMDENFNDLLPFVNFWKLFFKENNIDFQINYDWNPPMVKDTIFIKRVNPFSAMNLEAAENLHMSAIKKLGLIKENKEDRIIESDEYFRTKKAIRRPCSGPFKYMNIAWDGVLTVCCIDTERKLALGKIGEDGTLVELWEGRLNKSYRKAHIYGDLSSIPVCQKCRNLDGPRIDNEEIVQYMKKHFMIDEIKKFRKRMDKGI